MYTEQMQECDKAVDRMEVGDLINCMLECFAERQEMEILPMRMYNRAQERLNKMFELETFENG